MFRGVILTMQFARSQCLSRIRNTRRKMFCASSENHPLNNGGGYEVLTYLRQSWIPTSLWPFLRRGPRSRKITEVPAHSKSTSIDQSSASEKISRACLFVPRNPTARRRVPPFKLSSDLFPYAHTFAKSARANLAEHVPDPIFRLALLGITSSMARECVGGILRRLEKCRSECITGIQGLRRVFPDRASVF